MACDPGVRRLTQPERMSVVHKISSILIDAVKAGLFPRSTDNWMSWMSSSSILFFFRTGEARLRGRGGGEQIRLAKEHSHHHQNHRDPKRRGDVFPETGPRPAHGAEGNQ